MKEKVGHMFEDTEKAAVKTKEEGDERETCFTTTLSVCVCVCVVEMASQPEGREVYPLHTQLSSFLPSLRFPTFLFFTYLPPLVLCASFGGKQQEKTQRKAHTDTHTCTKRKRKREREVIKNNNKSKRISTTITGNTGQGKERNR